MIKNLSLQLNEAGKIKIGMKGETKESANGKEFRLPQKLDHFLLTTMERDDNGDFIPDHELMENIKLTSGIVNEQGNLVGIPVRLLYDEVEANFPTRYACYSGRNLSCYGDGEVAYKRMDDYKKEHPCPCSRLDPEYEGNNKCKPNGRLICMIDEAGLFGQAHIFRTTSLNSVRGIWAGMELIKVATKGRLSGLPLMLTLTGRHTERGTVYVVSVCYRGTMDQLRDSVRELAIKEKTYLLEEPENTQIVQAGTDEESDFVEEFYPDAATTNSPRAEKEDTQENSSQHVNIVSEKYPKEDTGESNAEKRTIDPGGRLLVEKGQYADMYNRFIRALCEDERGAALKLANRLTKEYIELFFHRERPDINFPGNAKKSEYLDELAALIEHHDSVLIEPKPQPNEAKQEEATSNPKDTQAEEEARDDAFSDHPFIQKISAMSDQKEVADAMTGYFKPVPVNRTQDIPGLIDQAKALLAKGYGEGKELEPKEKPEKVSKEKPLEESNQKLLGQLKEERISKEEKSSQEELRQYDEDSGPIIKDQLRTLVILKGRLEDRNILTKDSWPRHVGYFLGPNGSPVDTATKLSYTQGNTFISMLNKNLPEAEQMPVHEAAPEMAETDDVPF